MSSNDNANKVLGRFVTFLKYRLYDIHYNSEYCGKLVTHYGKTKRCYGDVTTGSCYNCDYTGYSCKNGCGNNVQLGQEFCSGYCRGVHYNF
jgi:hypothetical protein